MSYSYKERGLSNQREVGRNGFRGNKSGGGREGGGFRIRLSDNEMKAAKSLQDAFNLRSTVAVLGFALRTLAQMLEEGKLQDFLEEYRTQNINSEKRRDEDRNNSKRSGNSKPNPFARPTKPQNEIEKSEITEHQSEPSDSRNEDQENIIDNSNLTESQEPNIEENNEAKTSSSNE